MTSDDREWLSRQMRNLTPPEPEDLGEKRQDWSARDQRLFSQGRYPPQASIDLHDNSIAQALSLLEKQIALWARTLDSPKVVEVIHGRGVNNPEGEAPLRDSVLLFIEKCPVVLSWVPCEPHGASLVRLK